MFKMKIEKQLNLKDRSLLLGFAEFKTIPEYIIVGNTKYKIIGLSSGVKLPYISVEIERINENLVGKIVMSDD